LCLDFSDIVLQKNPFEILETLPQDKLILTSEGVIISDQTWNKNVINNIYGQNVLNVLGPYEVLNCGVTYGTPKVMSDFADIVMDEYEKQSDFSKTVYGVDQAIILKLIYHDQKINVHVVRDELPLAVHLHVHFNDKDKCRFKDINVFGNRLLETKIMNFTQLYISTIEVWICLESY
jgi:hypothetical protein